MVGGMRFCALPALRIGAVLTAFAAAVRGHGTMTEPMSRALRAAHGNVSRSSALNLSGSCTGGACEWYTQRTVIPGPTTNCDARFRTMGVACGSASPPDFPCTPGHAVPWCAPGTAPVRSPCGVFAGGGPLLPHGRDMLDLDSTPGATWVVGSHARVAWSMVANHGGGYSYRLCPHGAPQIESCFAAHHLDFATAEHQILDQGGKLVARFPSVVLSNGTSPPRSQWARNPIPLEAGMIGAIPGLPQLSGRGPFPYSVVDTVQVPAVLAPGRYTLSW